MSDDEEPLVISSGGDLILDVSQEENSPRFSYRVDSKILQQDSRYFENLLSSRFSEGQHLSAALQALKLGPYSTIAEVPAGDLPRISILNVGKIAISKASSLQKLVADLLRAVHGVDIGTIPPSCQSRQPCCCCRSLGRCHVPVKICTKEEVYASY